MADEYDTPRVLPRPVLNPANRAIVMVLHNLALQAEALPRALLDIARTIQLSTDELTANQGVRISGAIREHAGHMLASAQAVEESIKKGA